MANWEYFVLESSQNSYGEAVYCKGGTQDAVCPNDTPEERVLNIFGQHGYELTGIVTTRMGGTKYYFKRQKA